MKPSVDSKQIIVSQIFHALKEVFLSLTPVRSFVASIIKYDFKLSDEKSNLMQLCFSNLAAWPLVVILLLIRFDPFKTSWSLVQVLSFENPVVLFLLNGQLMNMMIFFILFFLTEWFIRNEYILLGVVFYFLNRSEVHIHLATVAVLGIYFSRLVYLSLLPLDKKSRTRQIWKAISLLQILAWGLVAFTTLNALDYIQINFLFNESGDLTRYNFLCITILLYHVFSHLFLSLWGHYFVLKPVEASQLPIHFSTEFWILKFNLNHKFKKEVYRKTAEQLQAHLVSQAQFEELAGKNPGLKRLPFEFVLKTEIVYLKKLVESLNLDFETGKPLMEKV